MSYACSREERPVLHGSVAVRPGPEGGRRPSTRAGQQATRGPLHGVVYREDGDPRDSPRHTVAHRATPSGRRHSAGTRTAIRARPSAMFLSCRRGAKPARSPSCWSARPRRAKRSPRRCPLDWRRRRPAPAPPLPVVFPHAGPGPERIGICPGPRERRGADEPRASGRGGGRAGGSPDSPLHLPSARSARSPSAYSRTGPAAA